MEIVFENPKRKQIQYFHVDSDQDIEFHDSETNKKDTHTPHKIQSNQLQFLPLHLNLHGNINHIKLLDALKAKYNNNFQAKLKVIFTNHTDFTDFKDICQKDSTTCSR